MGDEHRRFRRKQLGDGGLGAELATALGRFTLGKRRAKSKQLGGVELAFHIGDLGLDHLERSNRMAKGLALARVDQAGLVRSASKANCLRGDTDAAGIEDAHGDRKAPAFLAEQVGFRTNVVVELDLAGRRRANTQLGFALASAEPRQLGVDDEGRNPLGTLARRADRKQHDVARHLARGDPAFLAVDHPVAIRVALRARVHGRRIGTRLRLGQRIGTDRLTARNRTHHGLLLLFAAMGKDAVADQRIVDRHDGGMRAISLGDFHHGQRERNRIHAGTTVFVRHFDAHQSKLAHLADVRQRELGFFVQLGRNRRNTLLGEITGDRLDRLLVFGVAKIHERLR